MDLLLSKHFIIFKINFPRYQSTLHKVLRQVFNTKSMHKLLLLLSLITMSACNTPVQTSLDLTGFYQCWKQSVEETNSRDLVYRPCSYKQSSSYETDSYTFSRDGTILMHSFGTRDQPIGFPGKLEIRDSLLYMQFEGMDFSPMKVVQIEPDLLILKVQPK
ncbi:MAG: hypothetical protein ACI9XO_002311 [Paraglaciecola sp.]|jgi:hypothetical protein